MSDRGRENKKRSIGIRWEGKKISYGWCRWETREIEVGHSKVVLCICQFNSARLWMYNLLMQEAQHMTGRAGRHEMWYIKEIKWLFIKHRDHKTARSIAAWSRHSCRTSVSEDDRRDEPCHGLRPDNHSMGIKRWTQPLMKLRLGLAAFGSALILANPKMLSERKIMFVATPSIMYNQTISISWSF